MVAEYVAYYRVSTSRQGESGLGLEAQRAATLAFVAEQGAELADEFTEIESGRRSDRPKLEEALDICRKTGATLLIAKLDRLARNVHFISGLLETKVRFVAIDMPNADRFMLHVYAAIAEEESRRIGERTKAALAAAKARGVVLGVNGNNVARERRREADRFALQVGPTVRRLREVEGLSIRAVSDRLNHDGVPAFSGAEWHPTTVQRVWKRFGALSVRPIT